jgi:hypothetical protein
MKKSNEITVSIAPNEIVFPGTVISIESRQPLDPESAQGGIVLRGLRGRVQLSKGARVATWKPEGVVLRGHHTLLIRGLLTKKHRPLGADLQIPFFVADSRAKVPGLMRVESMQRLRIHDLRAECLPCDFRPQGKFIEIMKASNRQTGMPKEFAFNETGRKIEPGRIFQRIQENRIRKFGKLHETLAIHLQKSRRKERVPVALWLRHETAFNASEKRRKGPTSRPTRQALDRRKAIAIQAKSFAKILQQEHGVKEFRIDPVAPVVYTELTPVQIRRILKRREVVSVFLHETQGIDDLVNSIAIANSDDVHSLGFKGSGVKAAVWENGPDVTTNLSITASFTNSVFNTEHARHTHAILKNIEPNKPHGHAPSCSLHSANSPDLAALRWAVKDRGCTVINQSFHRPSEPGSSVLSYDDIYKDWLGLYAGPIPPSVRRQATTGTGIPITLIRRAMSTSITRDITDSLLQITMTTQVLFLETRFSAIHRAPMEIESFRRLPRTAPRSQLLV